LHHPTLAESLGLEPEPGLAECLQGEIDVTSAIKRLDPLPWYLIQAGVARRSPAELFQTDELPAIVGKLKSLFDWVLFDTPPVTLLTDSVSLSRVLDATLLVVRADRTPDDSVEDAISKLDKKRVLGMVFNGSETMNRRFSKYYGKYGKK
jgi:Mrp family chromosome partitioning ATPase